MLLLTSESPATEQRLCGLWHLWEGPLPGIRMERRLESEQSRTGGRVRWGEIRPRPVAPLQLVRVSLQAYLRLNAHLQCLPSCEAPCLVCRDLTLQTMDNATGLSDTYRPAQGAGKGIASLFACNDEKPKCRRWAQAWDGLKCQARPLPAGGSAPILLWTRRQMG